MTEEEAQGYIDQLRAGKQQREAAFAAPTSWMRMWMADYIREIKKQFRDKYGFTPSKTVGGEPCFDNIPDGMYPMRIEGKLDHVKIEKGKISCCNFDTV